MSKTPFEIRENLLYTAHTIATQKMENARTRLERDWENECELARARTPSGNLPKYPEVTDVTVGDVIGIAEKLYKFVDNK